ncbi:hypothetical protein [Hymenobacter arizonensis]|uniref:Histidine kinase-, DNA gyrase B-, and HSP90-like ATPase n=1 Tax=Hymenobacter arizonensis TaxID=1227077 RepID=A0A1I5Z7T7_HYMAR|nr:hypothetical protein [Hymenobacter arizonensis]SFQ52511.1 hypothetical protein SAMN04515668_2792 [Hymenobacter arizonensis]
MDLFSTQTPDLKALFLQLFHCPDEQAIDKVIQQHSAVFTPASNWKPLGGSENMYGVIENQQASPIAALVEKITNSIDATLMRKCYEAGVDPKGAEAPKTMEDAVKQFYAGKASNWDLSSHRKAQAENIQIVASGQRMNTSLTIYDNGEGQHPEHFENTFLSLLRGNKNEIHFVQGKYNMGGSGAIVFCGKRGYQLVASRRYDGSGPMGFTLIREHPLTKEEQGTRKNTWYEFLVLDGKIPSFSITELDLGLVGRMFTTGTIIKLYSYGLPAGSRSVISRDLNQSLNEFLFEPALPILTVDTKERYPDDKNLERPLFGLKRRLEQDDKDYVEVNFVEDFTDALFGKMRVAGYVFNAKVGGKSAKDTKDSIQREFFKNNMTVLFSMNGQVHGHYTSEFITRSLKLNLLKNHLLLHIDCTHMSYEFRKELFMASRDRLKDGEETRELRKFLASKLGKAGGRLSEIEKKRKDAIAVDGGDSKELLKNVTKNIQMNPELLKLLGSTFKLEEKKAQPDKQEKPEKKTPSKPAPDPFKPQRFPTFLKVRGHNDGDKALTGIPLGGEKTVRFDTDVENQYFNRVEEPGELKVALLSVKRAGKNNNGSSNGHGGSFEGTTLAVEDVLNVNVSSPQDGTIRITMNPQKDAQVGDAVQLKVSLTAPGEELEEIFWVKISDKDAPPKPMPQPEEEPLQGLPEPVFMYKEQKDGAATWEQMEGVGVTVNHDTIVHPFATGDNLEKIYINMDSKVLKNFRSKYRTINEAQLEITGRKYWTAVYMHTLFLYSITKNRKYQMFQMKAGEQDLIDVADYIKDLFENFYSEFILNFGGMEEMMQGLGE